MKNQIIIYIAISVLNLFLFLGIFSLLQNSGVYYQTLGKISHNYERTGDWNNYKIVQVNKPYIEINNSNLLWWDAPIYQCISKNMYTEEEACYGKVRAAFFPLFPLLWKATNSSAISISVINYFLFAAGLALMMIYFFKAKPYKTFSTYIVLLTLPTVIIFYIPYTEAIFMFCMNIAAIGLLKSKYQLYFIGALLTAMVRPATVFILFAILIAEALIGLRHQHLKLYLKDSFLKGLPFGLGYLAALGIQYLSSGSWLAFSDAHAYWSGGLQKIGAIVDWSIEGFGMNAFSIVMISLPALAFCLYVFFSVFAKSSKFLNTLKENKVNYIFLVSMLYLAGILIFTGLTSGGNLHSYFRFTMASPLFYLGAIILLGYLSQTRSRYHLLIFSLALGLLIIFMNSVPYGGQRFTFAYMGQYLLVITSLFLLLRKYLPQKVDIAILTVFVFMNSVWTTYLLNAYMSNGWLFT
jgi:hypothetical protein